MVGPNLEQAAQVIAENVVSAVVRDPASPLRDTPMARDAAITAIMVALLRIMPTDDSNQLAAACNRGLDDVVGAMGLNGPRVEAVDPDDGAVTMTSA